MLLLPPKEEDGWASNQRVMWTAVCCRNDGLTHGLFTIAAVFEEVLRERQLVASQLQKLMIDADDVRLMFLATNHKLHESKGNGSVVVPDYSYADDVIDNPPSDSAAGTLYYQLTCDTYYCTVLFYPYFVILWFFYTCCDSIQYIRLQCTYSTSTVYTVLNSTVHCILYRPFQDEECCARDPKYWRRLAVAQYMLGYVKGESNREVLLNYMRLANETAYRAIRMGANDTDTFTWCAVLCCAVRVERLYAALPCATSVLL